MPEIASAAQIAEKWARVTPSRAEDYVAGVKSPKRDWAEATTQAEKNYNDGVQAAIGRGAFAKGVQAASTQKWKRGASEKGSQRWGQGVQYAKSDYQAGFEPYRQVIASTTLPPRGPRGSKANYQRVIAMGEALHQKRLQEQG